MILLASAAAFSVFAAAAGQDPFGALSTAFPFRYKNGLAYTVTIPSAVTLTKDGT